METTKKKKKRAERKANLRTVVDSYKYYREKFGKKNTVTRATYLRLNYEFILFVVGKLMEGHTIEFISFGRFDIIGREQKIRIDKEGNIQGLSIDYKSTNELWRKDPEAKKNRKRVYYDNIHSNNVIYKLRWLSGNNSPVRGLNYRFLTFIPSRANKRGLAKLIKSGKEYFIKTK